jgi:benzoyl-CoA reductase subunit C
MRRTDSIIETLRGVANDPMGYAADWKRRQGGRVVGILPMNFPAELVHASGALPMLIQEGAEPITLGRGLIFEFYCGYTRSLVDQAMTGRFAGLDAIVLVDHCVALLGAADAIRFALPDTQVFLAQFAAGMDEDLTPAQVRGRIEQLRTVLGPDIDAAAVRASIGLYNRNRQLLRQAYDLRHAGAITLSAAEMQVLVKSAMVMDIAEHTAHLEDWIAAVDERRAAPAGVRLHLSGHFCHAAHPDLLDMIESCGTTIVDDDLFTGYRHVSTDVAETGDPFDALTAWYFQRNDTVPCATRAQKSAEWEQYLLRAVTDERAQGVIVLMPKFCEPHMLYYPELKKAFDAHAVPHLLIETEHEGLALESVRVRVEAFVETVRRRSARPAVPA